MPNYILTFILTIFIYSSAIAANLFTVDDIKVSSNGATAKQAKDTAVMTGQREAFGKLLERIASNPRNSALVNIDSAKLGELVQGVEVNDEKITASYYAATLSISFNKSLVEKLLQDNSVNFTEKKSEPIVLVPLLSVNGQNMLFEEENPLRKALADIAAVNHVLTIIVPVNLRGVDKVKLSQNLDAMPQDIKDSLLKLGQNYKADKIILIAASQIDKDSLNVRLQDVKDPSSPIKEISFKARDANAGENIFSYTARGINSVLESQWVKGKTSSNNTLAKVTLTIPIVSLDDWLTIKKRLENFSFIKGINVKTLTVKYALVDISFEETFENLNAKMNENGLVLENTGDNIILRARNSNNSAVENNANTKTSDLNGVKNDPQG